MAHKIISARKTEWIKRYEHRFYRKVSPICKTNCRKCVHCENPGWLGFECDALGTLQPHYGKTVEQCTAQYESARVDPLYEYEGIHTWEQKHTEAAILQCDCGEHVTLYGFTNTCDCGADYNMSGQLLAARSQWGEETGESASDILNHDYEGGRDVEY